MINPAPAIRKAYYDLLNGAVEYEGAAVPVYEGRGVVGKDYQILITDTSWQSDNIRNSYSGTSQQLIEVITEKMNANPMKIVDEIGNIVMDLIKPEPGGNPLTSEQFQFLSVKLISLDHRRERSQTNTEITILQLRYNFKVNQKNV